MPESMITSRQNPRIKAVCALRNRSSRTTAGQALVYGVRESQRALAVGAKPVECFWCRNFFRGAEAAAVVQSLAEAGAESFEVSSEVFEKIGYGDRLDGVVSVFEVEPRGLADLQLPERPLIAVLEGVEKPGNLGAVLRSADGAGLDAVVVVDPVIDLFNPNAIRSSVAAVFQPNVVVATAEAAQRWLADRALTVWTARPDASATYFDADYTRGGAIALGNEATGLTDHWRGAGVVDVAIPMCGVADSLNVSATAAVLFYEARRQRMIAAEQ